MTLTLTLTLAQTLTLTASHELITFVLGLGRRCSALNAGVSRPIRSIEITLRLTPIMALLASFCASSGGKSLNGRYGCLTWYEVQLTMDCVRGSGRGGR